ncbi:hypothetical protein GCM10010357_47780 [Streptomyces luteireticuli]|uniref:Uncharacterized protein n=1 Tax=Streptomyces luteireticuli TaxID=173858 RepID=A0ABP3ITV1_9ACTN
MGVGEGVVPRSRPFTVSSGAEPRGPAPRLRRGRARAAPPAPPLPGLRPWPPFVAAPPLVLKRRTGWISRPRLKTSRLKTLRLKTSRRKSGPGAHFSPSGA